eukprot:TRINITY_DN11075_c0_g1_i12.p1 TRINITY_DN11075_c0_g1~~TRINITY_DN11075_c0_g1_i12.p1  ORF type:complete len:422 (-),score=51.30 TRINITY_DN11075_c0_g1_i12:734-1999(-)
MQSTSMIPPVTATTVDTNSGASSADQQWQKQNELPNSPTNVSFADMQLAGMLQQASHQYGVQGISPMRGIIPTNYVQPMAMPPSELLRNLSISGVPVPTGVDMSRGPLSPPGAMRNVAFQQPNFLPQNQMGAQGGYYRGNIMTNTPRHMQQNRSIGSLYDIPPNFNANYSFMSSTPTLSIGSPIASASSLSAVQGQNKNTRKTRQQEQLSANKERTIYVSEVEHNVTEADLAILFNRCGDVQDVRLCGDAHSKMRFAFVEFSQETWRFAVPESLKLNNTILRGYPIRVQKSRTAIVPIKKELLPRNDQEMEKCNRTIYASNIDRRFTKQDIVTFFEALSVDESVGADGKVCKIKMFGDSGQNTQIAFLEFFTPQSATCALNKCQGALMGCLPLRVSPSKTPIRSQEEEQNLRDTQRGVNTH